MKNIFILFLLYAAHGNGIVINLPVTVNNRHSESAEFGQWSECVSNEVNGICKPSGSCTPGTENSDSSQCRRRFDCCTPAINPCYSDEGAGVCAPTEACNNEDLVFKIEKSAYCKTGVCCILKMPLTKTCFVARKVGSCKISGSCDKTTMTVIDDYCAAGRECCIPKPKYFLLNYNGVITVAQYFEECKNQGGIVPRPNNVEDIIELHKRAKEILSTENPALYVQVIYPTNTNKNLKTMSGKELQGFKLHEQIRCRNVTNCPLMITRPHKCYTEWTAKPISGSITFSSLYINLFCERK